MKLGIYTPTHSIEHLAEAARSVADQKLPPGVSVEWCLLANGGVSAQAVREAVGLATVIGFDVVTDGVGWQRGHTELVIEEAPPALAGRVGALKALACERLVERGCFCLVELDHDDALAEGCLSRLFDAHMGGAGFVASDCAMQEAPYRADFGWVCHSEVVRGNRLWVARTPEICARSLYEIFYAPNHVRSWTAEAYREAGGYDSSLTVADDHDLMARTYIAGTSMRLLHEALYIQRSHEAQTQRVRNADIQKAQAAVGARHLYALATEQARRSGQHCIDLGGAIGCPPGYVSVDSREGADVVCDVRNGLPYATSTVGVVRAHDFLEHVPPDSVVPLMNEIYRVLAPGGWLLTSTPSTDGRGAWQDPTHRSGWNSNSWWYYTRAEQAQYVPDIRCRFQLTAVKNHFPSDWHQLHQIVYCDAALWALKGQQSIGATEI